ncbi:hypothetical protein ACPPVO_22475 [Dactylosporangium sp. McL0621]|uniref:hypothetical protein n=1 Tax=Dactylosporangium sp. McL0621 TaxID=3415678 RepID=UPI003CE84887
MTAKLLGLFDEPQDRAAVVATNYGDYHQQMIWLKSEVMDGHWIALGGDGIRPQVVNDPRNELEKLGRRHEWRQPSGTVPSWPRWEDVVAHGPVVLLTAGDDEMFASGWRAGIRHTAQQMEGFLADLELDEPDRSTT